MNAVAIICFLAVQLIVMIALFQSSIRLVVQTQPQPPSAPVYAQEVPMTYPGFGALELPRVTDPMRGPSIQVDVAPSPATPPFRTYQPSQQRRADFQKVGYAYSDDKSTVVPIYSRPAPRNPSRFQYYTNADGQNVSMGIRTAGGECLRDIGCEELQTGDKVTSEATNGEMSVTIYDHA